MKRFWEPEGKPAEFTGEARRGEGREERITQAGERRLEGEGGRHMTVSASAKALIGGGMTVAAVASRRREGREVSGRGHAPASACFRSCWWR